MLSWIKKNIFLISLISFLFLILISGFIYYSDEFMPNFIAELAGILGGALFTFLIIDRHYKNQEQQNWEQSIKYLNMNFCNLISSMHGYLRDVLDSTMYDFEKLDGKFFDKNIALNDIKIMKNAFIDEHYYNNHGEYGLKYLIKKTEDIELRLKHTYESFLILPKNIKINSKYSADFKFIYNNFLLYSNYLKSLNKKSEDELKQETRGTMANYFNAFFLFRFIEFAENFINEFD